jgi:hypothetical protein
MKRCCFSNVIVSGWTRCNVHSMHFWIFQIKHNKSLVFSFYWRRIPHIRVCWRSFQLLDQR